MVINKVSKNLIALFAGNVVSQFIVFYSFVYLAGILEPAQFGLFSFAQALVNFFSRGTEFGLETIAVRRMTQSYEKDALFENVSLLRSVLSVFVVLGFLGYSYASGFDERSAVLLILSLSTIGISFSLEWRFLAQERMFIVSVIRTVRSLLFFVPLVVLVTKDPSVMTSAWLYSISFLLLNGIVVISVARDAAFEFSKVTLKSMGSLMKESASIAAANMLMQIQYYFSTFILGILHGNDLVAVFSAAYRPLLAVWSFGIMAVYNAIFPLMNSVSHNTVIFSDYVGKITRMLVFAAIGGFIVMYPLSETFMIMFYHGKYPESGHIFGLTLIIISIVVIRTAVEYSLVSLKMQMEYLRGMILVGSLYVILCSIFAKEFEINGVIYASITAELIYTGYLIWTIRRFANSWYYFGLFSRAFALICICMAVFDATRIFMTDQQILIYSIIAIVGVVVLRLFPWAEFKDIRKYES